MFPNRERAGIFENKLHQKFQVHINERFYNRSIANEAGYSWTSLLGRPKPKSFGEKVSKRMKGVPKNPESIEKGLETKRNNIDEDGKNSFQRMGEKSSKTRTAILEDGSTIAKRAARKMSETKLSDIDENGLNMFERASRKAMITKKTKICENGKTIFENSRINLDKNKREKLDEMGKNVYQVTSEKAAATMREKDENGISIYDRNAEKGRQTKQKMAKRYDVYHISGEKVYSKLTITDIRGISDSLRYKRSKDDYLAKALYIRNKFINLGWHRLIGLYIVPILNDSDEIVS